MNKGGKRMGKRKRYIESCQISQIRTYRLNGYPQKVLLEGKDSAAPILLFLHGGPGSPLPLCAGSRGLFPEITDRFVLVCWDQLGCGLNDYPIDDTFSIESFVEMTVDLIRALRADFPENPINLFGVSWGSVLAAKAAARLPDLIHSVLVYGQVTKELFFNREVFDTLEKAVLNRRERETLARLKAADPIRQEDIMAMAKLIRSRTEGYQAKNGGKMPMAKFLFGLLTSPDYRFRDCKAVAVNGTRKNHSLFRELMTLDLRSTLAEIAVPYLMMQGDTDIVTSTKAIQAFVKEAGNRHLRFVLVKDSGHMPGGKGMAVLLDQGLSFLCTPEE